MKRRTGHAAEGHPLLACEGVCQMNDSRVVLMGKDVAEWLGQNSLNVAVVNCPPEYTLGEIQERIPVGMRERAITEQAFSKLPRNPLRRVAIFAGDFALRYSRALDEIDRISQVEEDCSDWWKRETEQ